MALSLVRQENLWLWICMLKCLDWSVMIFTTYLQMYKNIHGKTYEAIYINTYTHIFIYMVLLSAIVGSYTGIH